MNVPSPLIAIGKIGRPHGLDGDVIVFPLGRTLQQRAVPWSVTVGDEQGSFTKSVSLTGCKAMNDVFKCKFSGFDSPEAVGSLKGMFVYIAQEGLDELRDNQGFYHFELKGMQVVSFPEKNYIGIVVDVHNYPTTDAVEIKKQNGQTFIIGLDPAIVRSIDRQTRTISISLDLLEEIL